MPELTARLRLIADIRDFAGKLRQGTSEARKAMGGLATSTGKAGQALGTATTKSKGFFQSLRNGLVTQIKTGVMFAALYQALITFRQTIGAAVSELFDLDEALRKVQSISKDSDKAVGELSDQLLKAAREGKLFGQTAGEVATGMFEIVQAGFDAGDAFDIATVAAQAATAGFTDAATAGKVITGSLLAFDMEADKARAVADVLFQTVDTGVISFEELANGLGVAMAPAAQVGVSLEELGSAVALMTRKQIPAARAMTSLTRILFQFIDPSESAAAAAEEMGFSLSADTIKTHGLVGAMKLLAEATGGNEEALADVFDRQRALVGAFSLLADGGEEWTDILGEMNQATDEAGALQEAFDERSKAVLYRLKELRSQILSLITTALQPFKNALGDIADFFGDIIKDRWGIVAFFNNNAEAAEIARIALAGLAVALGVLIGGPFLALGAIIGLITGIGGPGKALGLLGEALTDLGEKAGVLQPLRLAWQDLTFAFEKLREGDLQSAAIGLATFIENLTGIKVPIADIQTRLGFFQVAWDHLSTAIRAAKMGEWSDALYSFREALSWAFGADAVVQFDKFLARMEPIVEMVQSLADTVASELVASFHVWVQYLKNEVLPRLLEFGEYVVDQIVPALLEFAEQALPFVEKAIKFVNEAFREFLEHAGPPLLDIVLRLGEAIVDLVPILLDLAGNVAELVGNFLDWLRESGLLETFMIGLKTLLEGLVVAWDLLYPPIRDLFQLIADNKPLLTTLLIALGVLLVVMNPIPAAIIAIVLALGFLRQHWDEISTFIMEKVDLVKDFVDEHLGWLVAIFEQQYTTTKAIILGAWRTIENIVKTAIDVVRAYIEFVMALIRGDWGEAWNAIKDLFGALWEGLKTQATITWNAFKDIFFGILRALGWEWENIWNSIKNFFTDTVAGFFTETIPGYVATAKERAMEKLRELRDGIILLGISFFLAAVGLGKAVVRGLWEGIASLKDWLFEQVKGFAEGIYGKVEEGLGKLWPDSPSEAGVTIGEGLIAGVQKGITNMLPALQAQLKQLVETITGSLGGVSEVASVVGRGARGGSEIMQRKQDAYAAVIKALSYLGSASGGPRGALGAFRHTGGTIQHRLETLFGYGADFSTVFDTFAARLRRLGFKVVEDWSVVPLSFRLGGLVPGPIGAPQLAVVHGGERVLPADAQAGLSVNAEVNITTSLLKDFAELKARVLREVDEKLDDAAASAGLTKPRFGTWGAGTPRI